MDRTIHRRQCPRLMLGIDAEIISVEGRQPVVLRDLSETGAKIQLTRKTPMSRGIMRWLRYEVFGEVVWQQDGWCGLLFDRPISPACLFDTRVAAPGLVHDERKEARRYAMAFVAGHQR
jgi:hypothetical protein